MPTPPPFYRSIETSASVSPRRKTSQTVSPTLPTILDPAGFDAAVAFLTALDPAFAAAMRAAEAVPTLRRREPGFGGLASIIVAQQVSTASATAIFGRLEAHFTGRLEAAPLLAATEAELKRCGLSGPKIRALRAIAEAVGGGTLDFAALATMQAEAAHEALVAVKGIGPWTADVFLLFCLGHADAFPAGDLALQEAARLALDLAARPTTNELVALGERWRPLRGVAAHCLWGYYRAVRGRAATLETAVPSEAGRRKPAAAVATNRKTKRR